MRELPVFKARCSQLATIMTPLVGGLTDKQREQLDIYIKREADFKAGVDKVKDLTPNMREEMKQLLEKRDTPPRLSDGVISYLRKWYTNMLYGDYQEEWSKYTQKGILQEWVAIDMVEGVLGKWIAKNEELFENEWICGTPDIILDDQIRDTKCPWDSTTFLDAVDNELSSLYWWQMQGYMWLCDKPIAHVDFCLVNTPAELTSNKKEICYDDIPVKYCYHSKPVNRVDISESVIERVKLCREWLQTYHMLQELKFGGNDD